MYEIEIENLNQPMLITKAKKRNINQSDAGKVRNKICFENPK